MPGFWRNKCSVATRLEKLQFFRVFYVAQGDLKVCPITRGVEFTYTLKSQRFKNPFGKSPREVLVFFKKDAGIFHEQWFFEHIPSFNCLESRDFFLVVALYFCGFEWLLDQIKGQIWAVCQKAYNFLEFTLVSCDVGDGLFIHKSPLFCVFMAKNSVAIFIVFKTAKKRFSFLLVRAAC